MHFQPLWSSHVQSNALAEMAQVLWHGWTLSEKHVVCCHVWLEKNHLRFQTYEAEKYFMLGCLTAFFYCTTMVSKVEQGTCFFIGLIQCNSRWWHTSAVPAGLLQDPWLHLLVQHGIECCIQCIYIYFLRMWTARQNNFTCGTACPSDLSKTPDTNRDFCL